MANSQRYPFVAADSALGEASLRPYLPLTLSYQGQATTTAGLLDTGAAVNVLPFRIGIELGALWEQQTTILQLTGNLAQFEARLLLVAAIVEPFPPVRLAFAWTEAEHVPLLLNHGFAAPSPIFGLIGGVLITGSIALVNLNFTALQSDLRLRLTARQSTP
jgi:hypothetical protein